MTEDAFPDAITLVATLQSKASKQAAEIKRLQAENATLKREKAMLLRDLKAERANG